MRQNTRIFHKIVFLVHHIIIIELSVKLIITEKIEIKLCLHKNIYNILYSIFIILYIPYSKWETSVPNYQQNQPSYQSRQPVCQSQVYQPQV